MYAISYFIPPLMSSSDPSLVNPHSVQGIIESFLFQQSSIPASFLSFAVPSPLWELHPPNTFPYGHYTLPTHSPMGTTPSQHIPLWALHPPNTFPYGHYTLPTHSPMGTTPSQHIPLWALHPPNTFPYGHYTLPTHSPMGTTHSQHIPLWALHTPNTFPYGHYTLPTHSPMGTTPSQHIPLWALHPPNTFLFQTLHRKNCWVAAVLHKVALCHRLQGINVKHVLLFGVCGSLRALRFGIKNPIAFITMRFIFN